MENRDDKSHSHLYSANIDLADFEIVKVIGRGSFAKVYLVQKVDPVTHCADFYALKVLKKKNIFEKNNMHRIMQERKVLLEIKHPFLVSLHYAF